MAGLPFTALNRVVDPTDIEPPVYSKEERDLALQAIAAQRGETPEKGLSPAAPQTPNLSRKQEPGLYVRDLGNGKQAYSVDWSTFDRGPSISAPEKLADPLEFSAIQNKNTLDSILAESQQRRAALQQSIAPDEESAWRDAQIDLQTINESNLDPEQKQQRIRQLQANYEKRVYGIRDKIRGDLTALDQAEQQAKTEAALRQVVTQAKLEQVASMGREFGWPPEQIKRMQYKTLGLNLPEPPKPIEKTPLEQYRELNPIFQDLRGELMNYRHKPSGKNAGVWQQFDPDTKTWEDVPEEDRPAISMLEAKVHALSPVLDKLYWQVTGSLRPISATTTAQALNPIAQGVRQASALVTTSEGAPLTEAQAREFLRLAGGNKDQARELARNQGYKIQ